MNNMTLSLLFKKFSLLFLLISPFFLSVSFAGRPSNKFDDVEDGFEEEMGKKGMEIGRENERVLKANTKDYGRYDPPPALVRPPFKLIPN